VLAIDADINQHLAESLGMPITEAKAIPGLGLGIQHVKEGLRGGNLHIPDARLMIKTTPPGTGSALMRLCEPHPVFERFARNIGAIRVMASGPMAEEDLGIKCYHSKVGAVEMILNHLVDGPKEYIVVDMTAGADAFASGLFTRFDVTFIAVEPTKKSVDVWQQYAPKARAEGVTVFAVGNLVTNEDDRAWLVRELGEEPVAYVGVSPFVKAQERGDVRPIAELEPETRDAITALRAAVDAQTKDWDRYRQDAVVFHVLNAKSWANASLETDLLTQIDPSFRYPA
jgi:CO dehydrogenase maturation factor